MSDFVAVLETLRSLDAPALVLLAWVILEVRNIKRSIVQLPCKRQQPPAVSCPVD